MPGIASSTSSNDPMASDRPTASELGLVVVADQRQHDQHTHDDQGQLHDPPHRRHPDGPGRQRAEEQHGGQDRDQRRPDQRIGDEPPGAVTPRSGRRRSAGRPRCGPGGSDGRPAAAAARSAAAPRSAPSRPRTASPGRPPASRRWSTAHSSRPATKAIVRPIGHRRPARRTERTARAYQSAPAATGLPARAAARSCG